ncbi:MAG: serine hydrolase domain-containing protein [Pacificimonas sp.]|jgi:CubicO group peptidase (beta-lactamase class C family)|nr:serine hydrolase domain-containing protein [Pacificimonas sp.]
MLATKILLPCAAALTAAAPALAVPTDFAERVAAYVDDAWPGDGPGASVVVMEDGEIVYAGAQGLADLEAGTPLTPDTVLRLASITKQFSAAVMMQLVDEGRVSLDDPVSKFLPDYPQPGASATIRQLLNHSSGIQSYTQIDGWMAGAGPGRAYTTEELVAEFKDAPVVSQPGEAFVYNNSGYVLVGAIIEAVTGKDWDVAVRERIAEPLGLETLAGGTRLPADTLAAKGYTRGEDGGWAPARYIHMSVPHAAGALMASATDLARWGHALHNGRVVSPKSYAAMITPESEDILISGAPRGLGLATGDVRGRPMIGHSGGIFGFSTDSGYLPDEQVFVAVLANADRPQTDPREAVRRLLAMAVDDAYPVYTEAPVDVTAVEPLLGIYTIVGGEETRTFQMIDGKLYTVRGESAPQAVLPSEEGPFFYAGDRLTFFTIEEVDGVRQMAMHHDGSTTAQMAVWTAPPPEVQEAVDVPADRLAAYAGTYSFGGPDLRVFFDENDVFTAQLTGQPPFPLKAVANDTFTIDTVGARLVFDTGETPAPRLTIYQGGQELVAERQPES